MMIYETDTDNTLVWNSTAWVGLRGPTASVGTNTTQLATTAFVQAARQLIQYQGAEVTVGTAGLTITFVVGRFTTTPIVVATPGYITASGGDPTGFVFTPYLGRADTTSVILKTTAGTQQVTYHAIATNI